MSMLAALGLIAMGCQSATPPTPSTPPPAPDHEARAAETLEPRLGRHRILLSFALQPDHPELRHQRHLIRGTSADEMQDRDLVSIEVIGAAPTLRSRYDVPADTPFQLLLLGKDTGVKLRRDEAAPMPQVYGLIDAMPMRRREMRESGR
jgi:hypothetical protein